MGPDNEKPPGLLARAKEFKELILIGVFLGSGVTWAANYFATREQLENYKCANDLALSMLVNTKSVEFLQAVVRSTRKELRVMEKQLNELPKKNETRKYLEDQYEEQKLSFDSLSKSHEEAKKTREDAFSKLQGIQKGTVKPCS